MPITNLLKPEVMKWFEKSLASELYASNFYKHLANQLQRIGMFGAQSYFLKESADELEHYQKLVDYINDMGGVAPVPAVPKMLDPVPNISVALELALETEMELMEQYKKFYSEAEDKYEDCVTATFLIFFLQTQRESVGAYMDLKARLELNPSDLFEFDEFIKEF